MSRGMIEICRNFGGKKFLFFRVETEVRGNLFLRNVYIFLKYRIVLLISLRYLRNLLKPNIFTFLLGGVMGLIRRLSTS